MTRVLAGAFGGLLVIVALGGFLFVGWALSVFGTEGEYEIPVADVSVPGAALYVNRFDVDPAPYLPQGVFDTYVVATSSSEQEVFVGVSDANAVQDLLLGVPYEAASELVDGVFVLRPVPGTVLPAPEPAAADIWRVSDAGSRAAILWNGEDGSGVLAVMNADGTAQVSAELSATLESPRYQVVLMVVVVVALVAGLFGAFLLARAVRSAH